MPCPDFPGHFLQPLPLQGPTPTCLEPHKPELGEAEPPPTEPAFTPFPIIDGETEAQRGKDQG